jgi:hypothetical protein
MALSKSQETLITKVRAVGGGELGITLDDKVCSFLVATIASDLGLARLLPRNLRKLPPFFGKGPLRDLRVAGLDFTKVLEALIKVRPDADVYFFCLATLHKARLKYERILEAQPMPSIEQVGPRGLLQFGQLSPFALASLLIWRKWVFDIDNRAAQESGYTFEPIIAYSMGGVSVSAKKSPVKRQGTGSGRQVDCLVETKKHAYEIKLRVTIAASGQGRWQEELGFPADCKASGYTPILIVLDPTENPKLAQLRNVFREHGGRSFVGEKAWAHLEKNAGPTMGAFLERYVRSTIQSLLSAVPAKLPEFSLKLVDGTLMIRVGTEELKISRSPNLALASDEEARNSDDNPGLS